MEKEKAQFKVVPIPHTTSEIFWVYNCFNYMETQLKSSRIKRGVNKSYENV